MHFQTSVYICMHVLLWITDPNSLKPEWKKVIKLSTVHFVLSNDKRCEKYAKTGSYLGKNGSVLQKKGKTITFPE